MTTFDQTWMDLNRTPFVKIELARLKRRPTFKLDAIQFETGISKFSATYQAGCERIWHNG